MVRKIDSASHTDITVDDLIDNWSFVYVDMVWAINMDKFKESAIDSWAMGQMNQLSVLEKWYTEDDFVSWRVSYKALVAQANQQREDARETHMAKTLDSISSDVERVFAGKNMSLDVASPTDKACLLMVAREVYGDTVTFSPHVPETRPTWWGHGLSRYIDKKIDKYLADINHEIIMLKDQWHLVGFVFARKKFKIYDTWIGYSVDRDTALSKDIHQKYAGYVSLSGMTLSVDHTEGSCTSLFHTLSETFVMSYFPDCIGVAISCAHEKVAEYTSRWEWDVAETYTVSMREWEHAVPQQRVILTKNKEDSTIS